MGCVCVCVCVCVCLCVCVCVCVCVHLYAFHIQDFHMLHSPQNGYQNQKEVIFLDLSWFLPKWGLKRLERGPDSVISKDLIKAILSIRVFCIQFALSERFQNARHVM